MKPFGEKSQMAALLSVFSAAPASSETVYEHRQLSGKEALGLWSLRSPSDSQVTTTKAIYSVPERNEH